MATFHSFSALERQLTKDVRSVAESARNEIEKELQDNVMDYYSSGSPIKYERTGTLLESPNTTPVSGGGNLFKFKAEMEESISYHTGTYTGAQVIEATETGAIGHTLGNHRYFEATRNAIPEIVDRNMAKFLK